MFKRLFIILLCTIICTTNIFAKQDEHKKIGLVLAGGGAKGVAHIGVLKVLEENGIPIDYISGTSMGALIGALYSIGYSASELDSLVRSQNWVTLLSDKVNWKDRSQFYKMYGNVYSISLPMGVNRTNNKRTIEIPKGFIKGQNVMNLFSELTIGYHSPQSFDSLPIPFACVAADISTGQPYIFREGVLIDAMRASMSIPGAFDPVNYKDSILLVDGGIVNNFPVDVAIEMGADITIGVDLDNGFKPKEKINNIIDIFEQLNEMLGYETHSKNVELVDLHLHPDLHNYTMASFTNEAVDSMIALGEKCARNHIDQLLALKEQAGYQVTDNAAHKQSHKLKESDTLTIHRIDYHGVDKGDLKWLQKIIKLKDSTHITIGDVRNASKKIYATGNYSQVLYSLEGENPYNLNFNLQRRPPRSINLGFRFDSEVYAALLINATIKTPRIQGIQLSISGRLGEDPWGEIGVSFGDGFMNRADIGYRIQYNDFHLYFEGKRLAQIINLHQKAYIKFANISRGAFNFQTGLRYEYYDYSNIVALREHINPQMHASGSYVSYQVSMQYNSLESNTFPKKGSLLKVNYDLLTNNFIHLYETSPASIISYSGKHIFRITNSVKFIPQIQGRIILKDFIKTPIPYVNYIGGFEDSRYNEQQISMPGIKSAEIAENSVMKINADIRYNIGRGHYAEVGASFLQSDDTFKDMIRSRGTWGIKAKYAYNAIFGPITLTYATYSKYWKSSVYIGIGHYF